MVTSRSAPPTKGSPFWRRPRVWVVCSVVVGILVIGALVPGIRTRIRPESGGPLIGYSDTGVRATQYATGQTLTFGWQVLTPSSLEPIQLESIRPVPGDEPVVITGAPMLLGPERVGLDGRAAFDVLPGEPPQSQATPQDPTLFTIDPATPGVAEAGYQVVFPVVVGATPTTLVGVEVTYWAAGRRFRDLYTSELLLCPLGSTDARCV